jgi:hypothetical protein
LAANAGAALFNVVLSAMVMAAARELGVWELLETSTPSRQQAEPPAEL